MSDFLARLAARALGTEAVLAPRLPSLFESTAGALAPSAAPLESAVARDAPAATAADAPLAAVVEMPPAPHPAAAILAPTPPRPAVTERAPFEPARRSRDVEGRGDVPAHTDRSPAREPPRLPAVATAPQAPSPSPPSSPVAPRSTRVAPQRTMPAPAPMAPARASAQAAPVAAAVPRAAQPRSAAPPASPRPRAQATAMPATPGSETVVHVSIGRIEVRAAPVASPPSRRRDEPRPTRLDDYLRQRNGKGAP